MVGQQKRAKSSNMIDCDAASDDGYGTIPYHQTNTVPYLPYHGWQMRTFCGPPSDWCRAIWSRKRLTRQYYFFRKDKDRDGVNDLIRTAARRCTPALPLQPSGFVWLCIMARNVAQQIHHAKDHSRRRTTPSHDSSSFRVRRLSLDRSTQRPPLCRGRRTRPVFDRKGHQIAS